MTISIKILKQAKLNDIVLMGLPTCGKFIFKDLRAIERQRTHSGERERKSQADSKLLAGPPAGGSHNLEVKT